MDVRATLLQWYAADGATVEPGDPIFELATDCASIDVTAPHGGVVRQLVHPGATVTSDQEVVRIDPL